MTRELAKGERCFHVNVSIVVVADSEDDASWFVGRLMSISTDSDSVLEVKVGQPMGVVRAS